MSIHNFKFQDPQIRIDGKRASKSPYSSNKQIIRRIKVFPISSNEIHKDIYNISLAETLKKQDNSPIQKSNQFILEPHLEIKILNYNNMENKMPLSTNLPNNVNKSLASQSIVQSSMSQGGDIAREKLSERDEYFESSPHSNHHLKEAIIGGNDEHDQE
jgi:hypothetical protein